MNVRNLNTLLASLLIFVIALSFYVAGLSPYISGGDSGELVAGACTFGVLHPPGYPLYTLLGAAFCRLPFGVTEAWRVGLLSSIAGALSATLFFASLVAYGTRLLPAFAVAITLIFSSLNFKYSTTAEVFALNQLLCALLIFSFTKYRANRGSGWLTLAAFTFGLGLSHHHTVIFIAIPFSWIAIRAWRPALFSANVVLGFLSGLSPLLYLYLRGMGAPSVRWGATHTVSGLLSHFFRTEYSTFSLVQEGSFSIAVRLQWFVTYFAHLFRDVVPFHLPILGVAVLLWTFWKAFESWRTRAESEPDALQFAFGAFVLYVFGFFSLVNISPSSSTAQEVMSRFWLLPDLLFLFSVGCALKRIAFGKTLVAVSLVVVLSNISSQAKLKEDRVFENYAQSILTPLPQGALLLLEGDTVVNAVMHAQLIKKIRPDVNAIDLNVLGYPWAHLALRPRYPDLILFSKGPFDFREVIEANLPHREVFLYSEGGRWETALAGSGTYTILPLGKSPTSGFVSQILKGRFQLDLAAWFNGGKSWFEQNENPFSPQPTPEKGDYLDGWSRAVRQLYYQKRTEWQRAAVEVALKKPDPALLNDVQLDLKSTVSRSESPAPVLLKLLAHVSHAIRPNDGEWREYLVRYLNLIPQDAGAAADFQRWGTKARK